MHPSPSWLFRFLARLPAPPDWFSPVLLLLAVFVAGFALGGTYVAMKRVPTSASTNVSDVAHTEEHQALARRLLVIEDRLKLDPGPSLLVSMDELTRRMSTLEQHLKALEERQERQERHL